MVAHSDRKAKLAVFDVEGVLMPKKRYLFFEVGRSLRFSQFLKIILIGLIYEMGLISVKSALKRVCKAFRGLKTEDLLPIFRSVPLMPGADNVFETLRREGYITVLISSGLPSLVVRDLALRLQADYAFGFELEENDGVLTGEISGDVLEHRGKLRVLSRILATEKVSAKDCVIVVDDRNNVSILLPEALKIGYNPDFAVRLKADVVVTGKLRDILAPIEGKPLERQKHPSRNEILRESIHGCGFFIPLMALYAGLFPTALFILVVTGVYVMSELARLERRNIPVISHLTYHAATQAELFEFTTAPIFFAFGILFTLLAFPSPAGSAAIAIFALGDSSASVVGRVYGKRTLRFNRGKTLEGSMVGFIFAFLGGIFYIAPLMALIGAAVAMTVEYLPLPVNDNFVTPLVTGAVLFLLL